MAQIMRTLSLILMFILAVGAPMLCKGGLLQHPCDESHNNSLPHQDSESEDGGCGHEDGCASDPCSLAMRPTTNTKSTTISDGTQFVLTLVALWDDSQINVCQVLGGLISHGWADPDPRPPAIGCSLPLLI